MSGFSRSAPGPGWRAKYSNTAKVGTAGLFFSRMSRMSRAQLRRVVDGRDAQPRSWEQTRVDGIAPGGVGGLTAGRRRGRRRIGTAEDKGPRMLEFRPR